MRELAPMGRMGHNVRLAVWSVTNEVMCDREMITGRKDLPCGEEVVWKHAGPRWC